MTIIERMLFTKGRYVGPRRRLSLRWPFIVFAASVLFASPSVFAQVVIDEVMYDLPGADNGEEWLELHNTGGSAVDFAYINQSSSKHWKITADGTAYGIKPYKGGSVLSPGAFAVVALNPEESSWSDFNGILFDLSASSLKDKGSVLSLVAPDGTVFDTFDYASFAAAKIAGGDGNSLQNIDGVWKAAVPTPGLANHSDANDDVSAAQDTAGADGTAATSTTVSTGASASAGVLDRGNTTNWPVDPQLLARITGPALALAGVDTRLAGEGLGLDKKPLDSARFSWNFGDGATKEGESVSHVYNFPGEYVVILTVVSGKFSATDRLRLSIIAADLSIDAVVPGSDGKIEIVNKTKQELDLSLWRVQSGSSFFAIPENTKIVPQGKLPLAAGVLGFPVAETASLFYPNGVLLYKFERGKEAMRPLPETNGVVTAAVSTGVSRPAIAVPRSRSIEKSSVAEATATVSTMVSVPADQTAAVALSGDARPSRGSEVPSAPWLYGAGGIAILGLGAFFLGGKPKIPAAKSPADKYTIVEEE